MQRAFALGSLFSWRKQAELAEARPRRKRRVVLRLWVGGTIVLIVAMAGLLAPVLAPRDPTAQDLLNRMKPPAFMSPRPSPFLLGSDGFGRDILSRILYGVRVSLVVSGSAILVSGVCGTLLGLTAGYYEGMAGSIIMRLADMQLAFPSMLLAITVVGIFGVSYVNLVIVLAVSGWVTYARVVYGKTRALKEMPYVLAARAVGATHARIIRRHILPNAFGVVIVIATLQVGQMILLEAALSFLGLGVPPPDPSLGSMLSEGRNVLAIASWLATIPGLVIVTAVLGVNFLGDGLREVLDPRTRIQ
ncbi:MAG: ABC transporter permease [Chloroflexi bacterium]|nr:ABC transporter permease [Chloroflexota bacterium]